MTDQFPVPAGWFTFGSLIDYHGPSECSHEVGEDGLPLWERPLWASVDARQMGKFDANGEVVYECPLCEYLTGPVHPDSRLANEAMRNHMRDKHGI
jgi:hypothetical protein